jgi:hypothetical protein
LNSVNHDLQRLGQRRRGEEAHVWSGRDRHYIRAPR